MGERLDYPSVSHISSVAQVQFHHQTHCRRLVITISTWNKDPCQTGFSLITSKDGNFNIVFAIKKDYESAYKALARYLLEKIASHKNFNLRNLCSARSPAKRMLQCWNQMLQTSSMWWRAATKASPPPSRWRWFLLSHFQLRQGGREGTHLGGHNQMQF